MKELNAAAIHAFAKGDLENFMVSITPGGIEAQEAQGQKELVAHSVIPKDIQGANRKDLYKAWGIIFHAEEDDLFVSVTLPDGWEIKASDHSMWSYIYDKDGAERAGIFYKAAFYDRSAHMHLNCRFRSESDYEKPVSKFTVIDNKTKNVVFEAGEAEYKAYTAGDLLRKKSHDWLNENFPDWKNPLAYWDN